MINIKGPLKKYKMYRVCVINICLGILIIFFKIFGKEPYIFGIYFGLTYLFFIIRIQYLSYRAAKKLKNEYGDLTGVINYIKNNYNNFRIYRHPSNNSIAFFCVYFAMKKYDFKSDVINYSLKQLWIEFIFTISLFFLSIPLFIYFVTT